LQVREVAGLDKRAGRSGPSEIFPISRFEGGCGGARAAEQSDKIARELGVIIT
jgi:hypothetical protein